ncbi:MAG: hypothetical protein LBP56_10405 [Odoribacteraceae bacterium]|nr:hypothetical protein [Odoribacteraceae bacterium]
MNGLVIKGETDNDDGENLEDKSSPRDPGLDNGGESKQPRDAHDTLNDLLLASYDCDSPGKNGSSNRVERGGSQKE